MRLDFCVACGERDSGKLEHHHLVPRGAGGGDEDHNLITLCHACHGRVHGIMRRDVRALTKDALAAAKARGTVLGGYRGGSVDDAARAASIMVRQAAASSRAADVLPIIAGLRADGVTSLAALAKALTARGIPTARGAAVWSPIQVSRVIKLAKNSQNAPKAA